MWIHIYVHTEWGRNKKSFWKENLFIIFHSALTQNINIFFSVTVSPTFKIRTVEIYGVYEKKVIVKTIKTNVYLVPKTTSEINILKKCSKFCW